MKILTVLGLILIIFAVLFLVVAHSTLREIERRDSEDLDG